LKRVNGLFENICSIDNLILAHKNAQKGKKHYKEIIKINENEMHYLTLLQEMLITKKFTNSKYEVFKKIDKGKEREIYKLPYFPDRILHHAILQVLEPIWKTVFIKNTYQSIKGRGLHKALKHLYSDINRDEDLYVLKMDIKKFYPSIDNNIMKSIIRKKIKCKDTLWLLDTIINSTKGVPIGNYLSQYLGNLYLAYMDHKVKDIFGVKYYRYCDDIVVLHKDKTILHKILHFIKNELSFLKLQLKSNYQIFPISRGIDFLGYRVFYDKILLRKSISKTFTKAVKDKRFLSVFSYYGWIKHCDCHNLLKARLKYGNIKNYKKGLKIENKNNRISRAS